MTENILVFALILVSCIVAYRLRSLTMSGGAAAFVVGLAVYVGFGLDGFILLGVFFVSSSMWSKYKTAKKAQIEEKLAKGATRDWRQVIANGGTAALLGIIHSLDNSSIWVAAFAVSLASANSDTWASEIGSLSRNNPIDIRTFTRIDKGTSGAVSLLGTFAALAGSLLIAAFGFFLFHLSLLCSLLIFIFGFLGNVIDTILGAFYQQKYLCRVCGIETEKKFHCGLPSKRIKGYTFVDNDMVNFLSGFLAAVLAIAVLLFTT